MIVELHILQNFAPANLNRDDTGAPKDCEFGGYRRARISSQAIKRAIRSEFAARELIPASNRAIRSKRLADELARRLVAAGHDAEQAQTAAATLIEGLGLSFAKSRDADAAKKTEYLVYLGEGEMAKLVKLAHDEWESVGAGKAPDKRALQRMLDGGKAADLALFGRMLADLPERNIDAASQVAHAISTNRISTEFDFYTAIDDLKPDDTAGADMMGTVEFNSACFYRYANLDLAQLTTNLGGDRELVLTTLEAFLRASVAAIPTGKQNTFAAQNPPSFVLAVVRERGLWSLTNAFIDPIAPGRNGDLIRGSVAALDGYWGALTDVYGDVSVRGTWCINLSNAELKALAGAKVNTFAGLVERVRGAVGGSAA